MFSKHSYFTRKITTNPFQQDFWHLLKKIERKKALAWVKLVSGNFFLGDQLYHHQLITSPLCPCGGGCDTLDHFLFVCPNFDDERQVFDKLPVHTHLNKQQLVLTPPVPPSWLCICGCVLGSGSWVARQRN
jgi:hypothetical protein